MTLTHAVWATVPCAPHPPAQWPSPQGWEVTGHPGPLPRAGTVSLPLHPDGGSSSQGQAGFKGGAAAELCGFLPPARVTSIGHRLPGDWLRALSVSDSHCLPPAWHDTRAFLSRALLGTDVHRVGVAATELRVTFCFRCRCGRGGPEPRNQPSARMYLTLGRSLCGLEGVVLGQWPHLDGRDTCPSRLLSLPGVDRWRGGVWGRWAACQRRPLRLTGGRHTLTPLGVPSLAWASLSGQRPGRL